MVVCDVRNVSKAKTEGTETQGEVRKQGKRKAKCTVGPVENYTPPTLQTSGSDQRDFQVRQNRNRVFRSIRAWLFQSSRGKQQRMLVRAAKRPIVAVGRGVRRNRQTLLAAVAACLC